MTLFWVEILPLIPRKVPHLQVVREDTTVPSNRHIQPVYGDELITNIPPIDAAIFI